MNVKNVFKQNVIFIVKSVFSNICINVYGLNNPKQMVFIKKNG